MKKVLMMVSLVVLLAACSQQQAKETLETQATNTWKPLGGALDIVTKNNAVASKALLDRNGKLVVVWAEDNGLWYLQAKRWNGTTWERLAFPSKPLPYTEEGVNAFDVVFDSSNALVVSEKASSGKVRVFKNAGSSWTKLGGDFDLNNVNLETDGSGRVYGFSGDDAVSIYTVKRWNGSTWVTSVTFQKQVANIASIRFWKAFDFLVRADGKPVVVASDGKLCQGIYGWTGTEWKQINSRCASGLLSQNYYTSYRLNANNQLFYSVHFSASRIGVNEDTVYSEMDNSTPLGTFDRTSVTIIGFRNSSPILSTINSTTRAVLQKVNGSWKPLGNRLERESTKTAFGVKVVSDTLGNTFAITQEAACVDSAYCGGANIYVSQYIQ